MRSPHRGVIGALLALIVAAAGDAAAQTSVLQRYIRPPTVEWRLPGRLREISGLAMTPDDRLFAHDDEEAVIYEIDYRGGRLVKAFAMGEPTAQGDFEGIAYADGRFYLTTSNGRLYESSEGRDGERMLFNTYGTGVGNACEVEGLAFEPSDRTLLLLCKEAREKRLEDHVAIFRWSLDRRAMADDSLLLYPMSAFTEPIDEKNFHPSGLERHPTAGTYVIVAAREEAVAEVSPNGEVVRVMKLPRGQHRQAEGITFSSIDTLFISDEGGSGRSRLVLYPSR